MISANTQRNSSRAGQLPFYGTWTSSLRATSRSAAGSSLTYICVRPLMRITLVIAVLVLMTSCAPHPAVRVKANRPLTAEETRIIEIARQAVATNDTWIARAEFEAPKRDGSGWRVLVWRLPYTPGGYRVILIDENGRVTAYHRGL